MIRPEFASRWLAWLVVAAWMACTLTCVARIDSAMYSDPGWGVLAAEQHFLGRSPGIRTLVMADPGDLDRDASGTLSWWAPSYQALPFAFRSLGSSWGSALRATEMIAWLAALLGWGVYFRKFVRAADLAWLLLCFSAFRYVHAGFHIYDGELLLLAAFPWVLLLNVRALRTRSGPPHWLAALAGAATTALFSVKYSALLNAAALAAVWVFFWLRRGLPMKSLVTYGCAAIASLAIQQGLGVPGGPTPGDVYGTPAPERAVAPFAWLSLAFSDFDALVEFVLGHPSRNLLTPALKVAIGLVLLVPLAVLARRLDRFGKEAQDDFRVALHCAIGLVIVVPLALGALLVLGAPIDNSARHVRMAAVAALPVVYGVLVMQLRQPAFRARLPAAIGLGLFFVLPALYGSATLLDKSFRRPRAGLVAAAGVRLDLLGETANASLFYDQLRRAVTHLDAVFYWTSPDLALAFADRRILVRHADFASESDLATQRYRGCPKGGVVLVLPEGLEQSGKPVIIRNSFEQLDAWRQLELPAAPHMRVWIGECEPTARAVNTSSRGIRDP